MGQNLDLLQEAHIGPMMEGAKENIEALGYESDYFAGKMLVADSNYSSPANLSQCKEECLDAYIPDIRFRTRGPRFATQERWGSRRTKRFQKGGCLVSFVCQSCK